MSTIDRAFIAAFRQEVKQSAAPSPVATSIPALGLPGAGVELVSITGPERSRSRDETPVSQQRRTTANAGPPTLAASPLKHTLHGPHRNITPVAAGKRPLSSFAKEHEEGEEFRPAEIIPRLHWPLICTRLGVDHSDRLAGVLETLGQFRVGGTQIVGIAGSSHGIGCTTLTLALARQAARLGRRIALVEADCIAPSFSNQLELPTEQGLSEMLVAKVELPAVTTYAHDDRVAVVAWGKLPAPAIDGRRRLQLSLAAGRLRFAYDLVLLDLGSPTPSSQLALDIFAAMHGDALLAVASKSCPAPQLADLQERLESIGRPVLGIIENNAPLMLDS